MVYLYKKNENGTNVLEMEIKKYQELSNQYFEENKSFKDEKIGVIVTESFEKLTTKFADFIGTSVTKVRALSDLK